MPPRQLTGADLLCQALIDRGVSVIFGIPGGAIMPFYHALPDHPALRHVLCRHEQGAGHAAQGYAKATGRLGVCVATSGPGATNLVTPIADAWMDGTPLLAITGQVGSSLLGTDAFQETDIIGITLPIVKHSFLITDARDVPSVVKAAAAIATSGRPGPVLIDITKDAQQSRVIEPPETRTAAMPRPPVSASATGGAIERAVEALLRAERPLVLAGQGASHAALELVSFAERFEVPIATTLLGLGVVPHDHPLSLGFAGMHGEVVVNRALQACDVLLVVGARLDDRVTGRSDRFARQATVIHVDIERSQLGKIIPAEIEIEADARRILARLGRALPIRRRPAWRKWLADAATEHGRRAHRDPASPGDLLPPRVVFQALNDELAHRDDVIFVADVGQHQMWVAQELRWTRPGQFLTSGGAGTMGFAVPAALGAALGKPDHTVWVVVGDGGFQMTSQELATIRQERIANIKIAIIDNGYLGMVRQWQQLFHERRYSGTPLTGPDFGALARAYGLSALTVTEASQARRAVAQAQAANQSVVIDFQVEREANVFPIVPPGAAIDAMMQAQPATR